MGAFWPEWGYLPAWGKKKKGAGGTSHSAGQVRKIPPGNWMWIPAGQLVVIWAVYTFYSFPCESRAVLCSLPFCLKLRIASQVWSVANFLSEVFVANFSFWFMKYPSPGIGLKVSLSTLKANTCVCMCVCGGGVITIHGNLTILVDDSSLSIILWANMRSGPVRGSRTLVEVNIISHTSPHQLSQVLR